MIAFFRKGERMKPPLIKRPDITTYFQLIMIFAIVLILISMLLKRSNDHSPILYTLNKSEESWQIIHIDPIPESQFSLVLIGLENKDMTDIAICPKGHYLKGDKVEVRVVHTNSDIRADTPLPPFKIIIGHK